MGVPERGGRQGGVGRDGRPKPAVAATPVASVVGVQNYLRPPSTVTTAGKPATPNTALGKATSGVDYGALGRSDAAAARGAAGAASMEQAAVLNAQIAATKHALEVSFQQGLDQNLGDVGKLLEEQVALLKAGSDARARNFYDTAEDTEKATAGQSESSFSNLIRERQDTMAGILEQGAGETDALRGMVAAARNWGHNQMEGNRAYYDSMRSVNQGIVDLNLDTQNAFAGVHSSAETERERLWQNFYDRRSESYTQLGNLYAQQQGEYIKAKEMKTDTGGKEVTTKSAMEKAYMDSAVEAGKSYARQNLPDWVKDYKGAAKQEAYLSNTELSAATQFSEQKAAEGSSLRKWS